MGNAKTFHFEVILSEANFSILFDNETLVSRSLPMGGKTFNPEPYLTVDPDNVETIEFSVGNGRIQFIGDDGRPLIPGDGQAVRSNRFVMDIPGVDPMSIKSVEIVPHKFDYTAPAQPVTMRVEFFNSPNTQK